MQFAEAAELFMRPVPVSLRFQFALLTVRHFARRVA
jgi:hypothetical protein